MEKKEVFELLFEFVGLLNDTAYDHLPEDVAIPAVEFRPFKIETDGEDISVSCFDWPLWQLSDDPSMESYEIKREILDEAEKVFEGMKAIKINISQVSNG